MMYTELSGDLLAEHRPVLFRYALIKLSDTQLADDAVQDTLLAALQSKRDFSGKSSLRTWLIGILKHKIADHWRCNPVQDIETLTAEVNLESDTEEDDFFLPDGHWVNKPKAWNDPETALKQTEFWFIYDVCQKNLPPTMAQAFMLREIVGLESNEICSEIGITEANYWVTLHRARLRLRECLEINWFKA